MILTIDVGNTQILGGCSREPTGPAIQKITSAGTVP